MIRLSEKARICAAGFWGMTGRNTCAGKRYRTRDPEASPFFTLVRDYFDEFEQVYPQRFQKRYGFWRPVIRDSIDKFLKCGDLKEGFARIRCPDCGTEFFVAFSCRRRCCCPSCDQKRYYLCNELKNILLSQLSGDIISGIYKLWTLKKTTKVCDFKYLVVLLHRTISGILIR